MEDLIRFIVSELVAQPDSISFDTEDGVLHVTVADEDLGSVIGRRGKTVRALRTVVQAAGGPELEVSGVSDGDASADDDSDEG